MSKKHQITQKKNEIEELKDNLESNKISQKKEAVRKIIDAMTRGKDVSILFIDVTKNIYTEDMELKKLVYLYITHYAKIKPDLALLSISHFTKDAGNKVNPFLRALAVRSMGCIRVKSILEYLTNPLKQAIKDEDSYVRKAAAICIGKFYATDHVLMDKLGFMELLDKLVDDVNAFVVANAVCSKLIIQEMKGEKIFSLNTQQVKKLLTVMGECNEWGLTSLLDSLLHYIPYDSSDAEQVIERIQPYLNQANPGVVLSSVKIIIKYLDYVNNIDNVRNILKAMSPNITSLMNQQSEIQYITLKNLNLILQKRPGLLEREVKIFYCAYNDPIYIKMEKLEILVKLSNQENILSILKEFKEYSNEVDVEFSRKAVKCIGTCAIKLEKSAEKCVTVLWEQLKTKIPHIAQEATIVIRDIFRKYPRKYEGLLKDLCDNIKVLDDYEAKASMI